uniref:Nbr1 FW domain-containing protein n=1 Tax=viral metagenome TaxID=1070528 RepID=A0A6C0HRR7_9ZZZZ
MKKTRKSSLKSRTRLKSRKIRQFGGESWIEYIRGIVHSFLEFFRSIGIKISKKEEKEIAEDVLTQIPPKSENVNEIKEKVAEAVDTIIGSSIDALKSTGTTPKNVERDTKGYTVDHYDQHEFTKQYGNFDSIFVRDVTFPDGSKIEKNQHFKKTWLIKNTGIDWPEGIVLENTGIEVHVLKNTGVVVRKSISLKETKMEFKVPSVESGETVEISADLVAPNKIGEYIYYFRLKNAEGKNFGPRLWAHINVVDEH